ncbi:MAG: response regulator [Pirellulales bacterium]
MSAQSLRVAVADDDGAVLDTLHQMLRALGHQVVCRAVTGTQLVAQCLDAKPDLAVTDIDMHEIDGLSAAKTLYDQLAMPIILVSAFCDAELIARARETQVAAYLIKPVTTGQLDAAIVLAMRRHNEFRALVDEAANLRQALADRKLIEQAKSLLMQHWNIDEAEAFRRMQSLASNQHKKMVKIAEIILTAAEALRRF